jgi:CRISPR-associated protein Cmr4
MPSLSSTGASPSGCLFTFYTLTPLHAGSGESSAAVDLAIQREKHTQYPVVYSSSMKGSLRWFFECKHSDEDLINRIFGKEGDEKGGSGQVVFTDAKILFFPVRSSEGVFKWVTCNFLIERALRDLQFIGIKPDGITTTPVNAIEGSAQSAYESEILLEDFPITANKTMPTKLFNFLTKFADEEDVKQRLIIVSNDVFKTLVTMATQVIARNVLDNNKKTSTNLWYEEVVPADAVFYTIMLPAYGDNEGLMQGLAEGANGIGNQIIQIGGNETIGYGFVKFSNNLAPTLGSLFGQASSTTSTAPVTSPTDAGVNHG